MNRRNFLLVGATGTSVLSGCTFIGDDNGNKSEATHVPTPTTNTRKYAELTVVEKEYDWKSGVLSADVRVNLGGYDSIVIEYGEVSEHISSNGVYTVSSKNRQFTVNVLDDNRDVIDVVNITKNTDRLFQTRFLKAPEFGTGLSSSDIAESRSRNVSYERDSYTFTSEIPVAMYEYFTNRYRTNNYGTYADNPYDKSKLNSIIDEFRTISDSDNEVLQLLIDFVQGLKYSSDSATTPQDEYQKFPIETLYERKGDCEDTAILLGALLRELGYGVRLILVPGHAALGIRGDSDIDGRYYKDNGDRYYYTETTGSNWNIGEMPEKYHNSKAELVKLHGYPTLVAQLLPLGKTEGGAPKYGITLSNPSRNFASNCEAHVLVKKASGEQLLKKELEFGSVASESEQAKTFWFKPPYYTGQVRFEIQIYESNKLFDKKDSSIIEPEDTYN